MKIPKRKLKKCSRGHEFYKTSDCPTCPICWPGYYKERLQRDFPVNLGAPALRALNNAKITKLSRLTKFTQPEVSRLHGVGPSALLKLTKALKAKKLSFKS